MAKSKKTTKKPTYSSIEDISKRNTTKYTQERQGTTGTDKPGVMFNTVTGNDYVRRISEQNQRIREESERRVRELRKRQQLALSNAITEATKKKAQELKYSPQGDQSHLVYAAKAMKDTPGAIEREQERERQENQKQTEVWKNASKTARYSSDGVDRGYQVYAAKQINDSRGSLADKAKQLNDFFSNLPENKRKQRAESVLTGDVEHSAWLGSMPEETKKILQGKTSHEIIRDMDELRKSGYWDNTDDVNMWTSGKRTAQRAAWNAEAEGYRQQIENLNRQIEDSEISGNRWDALLDLYTSPEVENERAIIYNEGYTDAQKQKARDTLNILLNKNAGAGTQTATERAQNFLRYNIDNMTTRRDMMNMDSMRRMAYDAMNGDGAYEQATAGMDRKQKQALDDRINEALDYVADPNGKLGVQKRTAEMQLSNTQEALKRLDAAEAREREYDEFMAGRDYADTEYHQENNIYNKFTNITDENDVMQVRPVDEIYSVLGGNNLGANWDITTSNYYKAALMDDEPGKNGYSERDIFLSYYNAGLYDEAWAFYQGLEPTLNQRYSYFEKIKLEDQATRLPVLSSIATAAATPLQTVEFIVNLPGQIKALLTGENNGTTDEFSNNYAITRYKNITRNRIAEALGKDWGWAYLGVMSGVDSGINVAIGKGLGLTGDALQYGVLGLFGTQAFETSLQQNMENGSNNFAYDWMEAFIDAAIETATEVWSVENWMGDPTNLLKYVAKIGISEPSEEIVGAIVEPYVKEMLGHRNQWQERAKQILGAGGYEDASGNWVKVTDADSATRQAMREWNHEIRMSAQSALLSVGPGAVYGTAQIASQTMQTGRDIQNKGGMQDMLQAAMGLDENTASFQGAQGIQQRQEAGKGVGSYQVGRLAQDIMREGREQGQQKVHDTTVNYVNEQLKELNINDEEMTDIIVKALEAENGVDGLTKEEKHKLNTNHDALNLYAQLKYASPTSNTLRNRQSMAARAETAAQKSVAEAVTGRKIRSYEGGINLAGFDEIREAERNGAKRTGGKREVLINGQFAKLDSVRVVKEGDSWKLKLSVNGKDVNASDLQATDYGTAQIIRNAAVMPEFYGERFTNQMLEAQEKGRLKSDNILDDLQEAGMVRLAGYAGIAMPQTTLDRQLAGEIWAESLKEHAENRKAQVAGANRKESGTVSFDGDEYGTEAYNKKVSDLDGETRAKLDYVAGIAQRAGVDARFMDLSKTDTTIYGWENKKGIGINIGGLNYGTIEGKTTPTGKHDIVVTFGHELTHWLQRNSLAGYNRLEQYIMNQFAQQRGLKGLRQRLDYFMTQEGLSLEDAMSEVVANGSDQILGDEQVAQHIQQTDGKLYTQIKNFVQNLVDRMKKAITGTSMQDSMSRDARVIMANGINDLRKRWMGAWDEALSGVAKEETAQQTDEETKNSEAETAEKYKDVDMANDRHIYDYDFLTALPDIRIVTASNRSAFATKNGKNYDLLAEQAKENALKYGTEIDNNRGVSVKNVYTGRDIIITKQGALHSTHYLNNTVNIANAKASEKIGELVKYAVPINALNEKEGDRNTIGSYAMAAPMISGDGTKKRVAVITVDIRTGDVLDVETYEQVHSASARKMNEVGVDTQKVSPPAVPETGRHRTTRSTMTISEFLQVVNSTHRGLLSQNVLDVFNEKKPEKGYWPERSKFSKAEQKNNEGASGSSMVDAIDNMEQAVTPSAQSIYDIDDTVKKDREYEAAVERGDIERATEMLMDKLRSTKGVIPFMAMEWDAGENRKIAKALKTGDPEAIATAAEKMSRHVPENAVLIPMPGRSGKVVSDSWTVKLANAIGEKTGRPVVIALEGEEHESRQEAKHRGEKGVGREDLGFRQVAEIPEGTFPIFIDNVVGSGVTADAAREAMGGGITLAYTKSLRSPGLPGLKNAVVTYESQSNGGGLIPLSERFNVSKRDVRYSRAEEALDAGVWMANLTPSAVQTEDERVLMQAYKDKRISISLCLKRQIDYKAKIRELESKESLTGEQRTELENLQDKLEKQQERMAQLEKEMQQITSSEGYAGMMYRYNMVLKDFVQGRTSEQVRDTVEAMLNEVKAAQEQITRRAEELKNLEQTQAVKAMKSFMGKTSLGQQASMLRKQYNSTMNKAEVEDRLAAMALKLASGQDIQTDAEALAADLVDKIRGIRSENLESLRGMTLNIGESLRNELKAENSSMKEIRGAIYGSGLMIKAEGNSRLTEQWNELRENNKALPDIDGMAEIDALHTIVDFISGELQASRGSEQYNVNMEEATAICYGAAASVTTYLVKDPAARKQITELMTQIKDLSRKTGSIAESMDQLNEKMQEVVKAGYKAADWTSILQNDVHTAIDYYNKVARQAAQEEKAQVKKNLIEQLRSENARKLYEQQDKYEELIKKNRQARELSEDNQALRKKINTNLSRLKKRLMEETDQKNIPEETKALARQLLGKIVSHDMTDGLRRLTFADKDQLQDMSDRLARMNAQDGAFDPERDLDWLVIKAPNPEDNDTSMRDKIIADLRHIDNGLLMYWTAEGNGLNSLQNRKEALDEIQKAVAEITGVIQARGRAFVNGKRYEVADLAERMEDEMSRSKFKGERTGTGSRQMNAVERALKYGNLTPEYFFKNLKNSVMTLLHGGFHDAENRSGLLAEDAHEKIQKIADDTGFDTWDGQEKHQVKVSGGRTVEMTTEQIMALYATWMRERNNVRPEDTAHLLKGGFVLAPKENTTGKPGREKTQQRPIRITKDQLIKLHDYLTTEQRDYVERIVEYMSTDLAEIGNEASMEAYGIRKFTEKYYFPIKSWGGVLNQDSARGITNQNDNRAMRQSFTKRITAGASNAIEISDFTPTAMKHVVGMITFNTVGPAVENLNKVLNQQLQYGDVTYFEDGDIDEDNRYKRSVRAAFQEAYGKNAADYLAQFMKDVNGGVTQQAENSLREKLLSLFKKNAVAGSLSVAAQQPLSYIRAAMMINPKYLAQALSPQYWRGSLAEMRKYSGVAMLKHMGKFDMNYGRSMIDYITPEGKQTSKAKAVYDLVSEKSTALPEKMDDMTWTRMWTAVKLEQAAMHPGADITSDAFLKQVAERFNELMRRTQVYDSILVKSQNMRSTSYLKKVTTSFMGEPTLSLNVLADAWQNRKEAGGKKTAIKALVTFVLSAAAQAGAKGLFGAGRSPDKKKNQEENFYNRFAMNLISEMNPLGLIPGYNQMMDVLMKGELNDDAMGVIGKATQAFDAIFELATGKVGDKGLYRKLEDSIGQTVQYATSIPLKNFMRDFRAMVNWFSGGNAKGLTGDMFAQRPTSAAVMKYQTLDALVSDDIIGLINQKLGDAGYGTSTADYKARIYQSEAAGDKKRAEELTEYVTLGKGVSQEKLDSDLNSMAKKDESLTAEKRLAMLEEHGYGSMSSQVLEEYRSGNLKRAEAEKRYRKERPNATDKQVLEALDKIDYEKKTGQKVENYSNYTPVYDALEANKADQIRESIKHMLDNGYEVKDIKSQINSRIKKQYAEADSREKVRLVDAMEKAYKVLGLTAADADKVIEGWKKEKKTTK